MSEEDLCVPSNFDGNVGLAFGIVAAAGLSTTLGAALAFVMPYSRSSKNLFLAACLSIAAGVMIYVSFVEILSFKAVGEFESCYDYKFANLYATLSFFAGLAMTAVFDFGLHRVQHWLEDRNANKHVDRDQGKTPSETDTTSEISQPNHVDIERQAPDTSNTPAPVPPATSTAVDEPMAVDGVAGHGGQMIASLYTQNEDNPNNQAALIRMGIFAGIALAFHNFPEGLATFVAVLEDPSVGASVAIAIAIHNIPEGVCVAMPIYYATGSRAKAFMWATLSGMTELIGALLGWVVLRNVMTPRVYGALFGVVAGMMVYISVKELIPTAHRYDPEDRVTSAGVVLGMAVMAASLVLFQF